MTIKKQPGAARLLALAFAFAAGLFAQSTAQIHGVVQDASGLAVGGAQVTVTQTETGAVRQTTSAADGAYILPNLAVGPYRVEATKEGFSRYVQTGLVLQVAADPLVDIALKVGSVTESVQVEANAALVETQNTGVGAVIENQRILELPLNGRQVTDLIQLAGAAVPQGAASSRSMQGGQAISVAGGQSWGIAYFLDGGLHNNPFDNLNLILPFPDALQEFRVETSTLTAQNGVHSAGAVNAVTKSGTNEIHGDLFWFVRNGKFNARNFFALRNESIKRNQFGGTIGGPIIKNKLFFFGGYQRTTLRQDPTDRTVFIPNAQMLRGDFSTYAKTTSSGGCISGSAPLTLRAPFAVGSGNILPQSLVDPVALRIAAKLPTTVDPCGKFNVPLRTVQNENQPIVKIDWQKSDKQTIFGRYQLYKFYQPPPFNFDANVLNTVQGGRDNLANALTIGDTYLIGSSMVNSFRAMFNRTAIHRTNADTFSAPSVGINSFSYLPKYMLLNVTNQFAIGGGTENEATFRTTSYGIADDFSMIRGSHQIAFGGTLTHWRSNGYANVRSPGQFTIDGSVTGNGLADFVSGYISSAAGAFIQSAPNTLITRQWQQGFYLQDTWKAARRLTVNLGMRWEPWTPMALTNNAIYNFDQALFNSGTKSQIFKNAPAGLRFPGDQGFAGQSGMNKKFGNFGPRIGIAWDPRGDGKTSIRASYGLAYDYVNGQFFINTANAPPWGSEVRINSSLQNPVRLADPFTNADGTRNIFPVTFNQDAPFSPFGPFLSLKPDQKTTGVHTWNLSIQHQFGKDFLVSGTYLGNHTQHLWVSYQSNPGRFLGNGACTLLGVSYADCSLAPLNSRRALSVANNPDARFIGYLDQFDDGGTQSYNGLLLTAQKRLSSHYSLNVNYTWSHCIGDYSQAGTTPNVGTGLLDPNNRKLDRGNCGNSSQGPTTAGSDRRHIFNLTSLVETPTFNNKTLRMVGTGWKLSGILKVSSGAPLLVFTTVDRQLSGTSNQRPNQILSDVYLADPARPFQWLNTDAFNVATVGKAGIIPQGGLGSLGRYNVFGPKFWDLSTSLSRTFKIKERQSLEFRAEAFNLTNSLRKDNPVTNVAAANFGQIIAAADPRIMQFALKYVF
jgi:hypothetical protein